MKQPDACTVVFALGLVLYELLTALRPLKRDSDAATLKAALQCDIPRPSTVADLPLEFDALVMKALEKAPKNRFQTAREFQVAIAEVAAKLGGSASSLEVSQLVGFLAPDVLEDEAAAPTLAPSLADRPRLPSREARVATSPKTEVPPINDVVSELMAMSSEVTHEPAHAVLQNAIYQGEVARRTSDEGASRVQRLATAQEFLGAVERSLHGRLRKLDADDLTYWMGVLEACHGKKGPTSLSDRQVQAFFRDRELPSLKVMAHWLSPTDAPRPEELSELLRGLLQVPVRLRTTLFALGQARNVLAHRQTYEAERRDLDEAATYLEWATADGAALIDIGLEKLDALRVVCTSIVQRK